MFNIFFATAFFNAYFQADFFGKMIFFLLFTISIISWVVVIQKLKFSKKAKENSKLFEEFFEKQKEKLLSLQFSKKTVLPSLLQASHIDVS